MKKINTLLLISFIVAGISCAFMKTTLREPKDEKRIIVVGSIAIDLFEYRNITKTYRSEVQVIIAGRYKKNGKIVHKNYWVTTDDRGYFYLANVPEGDYALRGFRFQTVGPSFFLTVINPLKTEKDKFIVTRTAKLPDAAFVFKYPVMNRIVNLRHNYFIMDRGKNVHQRVYYRLENLRLVTGKTLVEPDIVSYFAGKFPQSSWFEKQR